MPRCRRASLEATSVASSASESRASSRRCAGSSSEVRAFGAIEALRRTLSRELGPKGVRVITLQTGGIPEGIPDERTRNAIEKSIAKRTMLGRAATLEDVGNAAVFAASDWGRALTATKLNITCGTIPD